MTEAGYAAFLQDYAATWHTTAEEARAAMPKETYTFNQYAAHAEEVWRAHADRLYRDKNPAARRGMTHPHETQQEVTP